MSDAHKQQLHDYLVESREALLWKTEGLSEYDVRRPLTRTGTNLLGLVKHLAIVEASYVGTTFDRPFARHLPWWDDDAPDADMWATTGESSKEILGTYREAIAHADIVREQIDGRTGMREGNLNQEPHDEQWWADHRARLEAAARAASG